MIINYIYKKITWILNVSDEKQPRYTVKVKVKMYFDAFKKYLLENKCTHYMIDNLRTPPQTLVRQWGKQLKMDPADVERISDRVKLRFALGKIFTIKLS